MAPSRARTTPIGKRTDIALNIAVEQDQPLSLILVKSGIAIII
jgi:hypothetical protein